MKHDIHFNKVYGFKPSLHCTVLFTLMLYVLVIKDPSRGIGPYRCKQMKIGTVLVADECSVAAVLFFFFSFF